MIKSVVIFGLWWQGKQFINYFKKKNYKVYWICQSKKTKKNIESKYWIIVYLNYKEILSNNIDLLILSAFPIDIYEKVLDFSLKFNYKILSDLPITFDLSLLKKYIFNDKIYLFLLETQNILFNNIEFDNILKIECLVFQNKNNLLLQKYKKESIIVDTHYVLNNLLLIDMYSILKIKYKFIEKIIKDIEYIIKIDFIDWNNIVYKHENWKWILIKRNYLNELLYIKKEQIIFDKVLDNIISNINKSNNFYKKEYYKMFSYLLKKFNYEKK